MARRPISRTRTGSAFVRRPGLRPPRPTTLIVCEGETEEAYFKALQAHFGLAAEVIVDSNTKGSAPISVLNFAERRVRERGAYDFIFCVFDHDDHESFDRTCKRIRILASRAGNRMNIHAITSRPCFEFWVLLHFERRSRPFARCDDVVAHIRRKFANQYQKSDTRTMRTLLQLIDDAVANARWLAAEATGGNPGTSVHVLVEHLRGITSATPAERQ